MADILLKRQKLMASSVDHLTALNDDCISQILNNLDLRNLCAISKTCNKLRKLAAKQFQRKYPDAHIILMEKNKQIFVKAIAPHMQCFSRVIGNICVTSSKRQTQLDTQLLQTHLQSTYENRVITAIQFSGAFRSSFNDQIANTLQTIKSVDVSRAHRGCESILKHCQSVTRLMFKGRQFEANKYPSLEYLKIDFGSRNITSAVKRFFQLNPTIKHIDCSIHATYITQLVNILVEFCKNLEIVSLNAQIHHVFRVTELLYEPLKMLDQQESVKEIRLTTDRALNVNALASHTLKKLTHLNLNYYFSFGSIGSFSTQRTLGELDFFTNVHFLFLSCHEIKFNATDMAKKMPNLKEFHVKNYQRDFDVFNEVIMPFVTLSTKLEKIVAFDKSIFDVNPIVPDGDVRGSLSDACNLIIYLADDICSTHTKFIEIFNQKFNAVKILPAKFTVVTPRFSENTHFGIYYE